MHVSGHLHDAEHSVSHADLLRRLLMFHGPINEAVPFFEAMGFRCPERKDHASFLQEVTTPKGRPFFWSLLPWALTPLPSLPS